MDFSNETYVRVYRRQTAAWKQLGWEGQAAFCLLELQLDRTGALEIEDMSPASAISLMTGLPIAIATAAAERLLHFKFFEHVDGYLIDPTFIEAQESSKSPSARQQGHRLKRRDEIRRGLEPAQRETAIYFVQSEHGGEIKIGRAEDVARRLVGLQVGRPDKLVLLAAAAAPAAQERALHARFAPHRAKGEWFYPTPELVELANAVSERGAAAIEECLVSHLVTPNTLAASSAAVTCHSELSRAELSSTEPSRAEPCAPVPVPVQSWVRVWELYEVCRGIKHGSAGHATEKRDDLESMASTVIDACGAESGTLFDEMTSDAIRSWTADPWVQKNRAKFSHLAKHWGDYLEQGSETRTGRELEAARQRAKTAAATAPRLLLGLAPAGAEAGQ